LILNELERFSRSQVKQKASLPIKESEAVFI
jgi:hypothetical protein